MSVGELFHHESLFVGCLALRKVKLHGAGDTLLAGDTQYPLQPEDARLLEELYDAQLFRLGASNAYYLSIMTQAMDFESLRRCPALSDNDGCSIHNDRKPAVCSMVPFDSLYPDRLQNIVLLNRRFDENCIVSGQFEGYPIVFADGQVSDHSFRVALQKKRDDLVLEKQLWGQAVFHLVHSELLSNNLQVAKIPADDSALLLSITPVLHVLANLSEPLRLRCLRYIDSQIRLLDDKIAQAIARKSAADKPTTHSFRSFKQHYLILKHQLASIKPGASFTVRDIGQQESIGRFEKELGA